MQFAVPFRGQDLTWGWFSMVPFAVRIKDVIIKDTKGAEILNKKVNVKPDINAIYIDNVKSSPGIYYIYISNNIESSQVVKIVIK
jgi:hypothetical protein